MAAAGLLQEGKTLPVINQTTTAAGVKSEVVPIEATDIMVMLQASAVVGTLDVKVYAQSDDNAEVEIIAFTQLTAPTGAQGLVLKAASLTTSRIRVEATFSAAGTDYKVQARGLGGGSGSAAVLIEKSPAGLVTEEHDYIALTYVAAGNGTGEIETATYKEGGSGGDTVATVTITYDTSDRISTITKT